MFENTKIKYKTGPEKTNFIKLVYIYIYQEFIIILLLLYLKGVYCDQKRHA